MELRVERSNQPRESISRMMANSSYKGENKKDGWLLKKTKKNFPLPGIEPGACGSFDSVESRRCYQLHHKGYLCESSQTHLGCRIDAQISQQKQAEIDRSYQLLR